jgi:large subunit ribosomal protein L9
MLGRLVHVQFRGLKSNPRVAIQLLEDIPTLGYKGEIKHVKPGYARNYLLPQHLGFYAPKTVLKKQEQAA